jgi:hypothetical protein
LQAVHDEFLAGSVGSGDQVMLAFQLEYRALAGELGEQDRSFAGDINSSF